MIENLSKNRVVVAMSGGVDSSVAALLLKQAGYEVIGVMMKLWDPPAGQVFKHTSCCSVEDASDARRVADQLDIPFYVINTKERFRKEVIDYFVGEYLQGRTPNPCAVCNDKVKFDFLFNKAFELGAYYIATGHYARKIAGEGASSWRLFKGSDPQKDQSYFLFRLSSRQLEHTLFPVGEMGKDQVRALAGGAGLKTSQKAESQEICFVPDNDHGGFIDRYAPGSVRPGGIFNEAGELIGQHEGIHRYTVGQRRGTAVALGERSYVQRIDAAENAITMAPDSALYQKALMVHQVNWLRPVPDGARVQVRIRYRHQPTAASVFLEDEAKARVDFDEPQRAIAPGQAAVFYSGEEVLGGGWIERGLS